MGENPFKHQEEMARWELGNNLLLLLQSLEWMGNKEKKNVFYTDIAFKLVTTKAIKFKNNM